MDEDGYTCYFTKKRLRKERTYLPRMYSALNGGGYTKMELTSHSLLFWARVFGFCKAYVFSR